MSFPDSSLVHQEVTRKINKFDNEAAAKIWATSFGGEVVKEKDENVWVVYNPCPKRPAVISSTEED